MACFTVDHLDEGTTLLLDVLERRGVRTTCFVEGRHGEERPAEVQAIVERGHELGMHGWAHEEWHRLGPDEERELAVKATAALDLAGGMRPQGFRAPSGARTGETAAVLTSLGYRRKQQIMPLLLIHKDLLYSSRTPKRTRLRCTSSAKSRSMRCK